MTPRGRGIAPAEAVARWITPWPASSSRESAAHGGDRGIIRSRLQERRRSGWGFTQSCGEHTAGRASANDHDVRHYFLDGAFQSVGRSFPPTEFQRSLRAKTASGDAWDAIQASAGAQLLQAASSTCGSLRGITRRCGGVHLGISGNGGSLRRVFVAGLSASPIQSIPCSPQRTRRTRRNSKSKSSITDYPEESRIIPDCSASGMEASCPAAYAGISAIGAPVVHLERDRSSFLWNCKRREKQPETATRNRLWLSSASSASSAVNTGCLSRASAPTSRKDQPQRPAVFPEIRNEPVAIR